MTELNIPKSEIRPDYTPNIIFSLVYLMIMTMSRVIMTKLDRIIVVIVLQGLKSTILEIKEMRRVSCEISLAIQPNLILLHKIFA